MFHKRKNLAKKSLMSFAPKKTSSTINDQKRKHQQSPPKFSAEVVAKFDSNLRAFDSTKRKNSPKTFQQRKLSPDLKTQRQLRHQENDNVATNNETVSTENRKIISAKKSSWSIFARESPSFSDNNRKENERRSKRIFGGLTSYVFEDVAKEKARGRNDDNPFATSRSDEKRLSAFPKEKLSAEWICVHSKLVEMEHVEELLRRKFEELEMRHFAAIVNFRSNLEI